ncbi:MAG TPA: hypothetical protein HA233_06070 [Nanoarchaeota archaeon]|nr:hypothetical protein [Candidatus Woesearchaeota archaeon]HIH15771.1 hypothetical protein [Nanoarchaeota archaeon]HIJ05231.1 hypothetical protein [Nanoarchaeota archaeon]
MAETVLGDAVKLLQDFGFFDVILPFLLVFTVVFGILEKTKIFGTEGEKGHPKKNIDAMVAFVIAFFVIAAKEIVASFQESLPMVALILVAIICFLMLIGSFATSKEEFNFMEMFGGWKTPLAVVFVISIIAIFFQSFGWLEPIYEYISGRGHDVFIVVIFIGIIAAVVGFVFNTGTEAKS